jgi:hypothetical protein
VLLLTRNKDRLLLILRHLLPASAPEAHDYSTLTLLTDLGVSDKQHSALLPHHFVAHSLFLMLVVSAGERGGIHLEADEPCSVDPPI